MLSSRQVFSGSQAWFKIPVVPFPHVQRTHFPTCRSLVLVWPAQSFCSVIAVSHHVFTVKESVMAAEREQEGKTEIVLFEDIVDSAVIL